MEPDPTVLASLRKAVEAMPDDVPLRVHLATLLLRAGQRDEAIRQVGAVLQRDPGNADALALLQEPPGPPAAATEPGGTGPAASQEASSPPAAAAQPPATPGRPPAAPPGDPEAGSPGREEPAAPEYDWSQAESELRDVLPPMFVGSEGINSEAAADAVDSYDAERSTLKLADVAGMAQVKDRLEAAFLAPMRNPELRKLYGKSLRGGLLLYGPPGCGKTFIARAVAGEMGARFLAVSLADVLDMYIGQSERNVRELFETARRNSPCVIFLDEVDALGQKRSQQRNTGGRGTVNQLLSEMDGLSNNNDGVFVLGATNHPWDVDSALRRPGRFDRMLLVLPPDEPARQAVLRLHLRARPVETVDLKAVARRTEGYSGADLAHVCETAAEQAMADSIRSGKVRGIRQSDLLNAVSEIRPSTGPWLEVARN